MFADVLVICIKCHVSGIVLMLNHYPCNLSHDNYHTTAVDRYYKIKSYIMKPWVVFN